MQKILSLTALAALAILWPGCKNATSLTNRSPQPAAAAPVATTAMTNQNASLPAAEVATAQPARLIVKWRVAPQSPEATALRTKIGATSLQIFKGIGEGRMEVLRLPDARQSAEVIATLEASGLVEYAERDGQVQANQP